MLGESRSMRGTSVIEPGIVALAMAVFLLTSPSFELFHANQNSYFPHGLRLAGRSFLEHDWFANTDPLHFAFSYLIAALDSLGVLAAGTSIITTLLDVALLSGIWLVVLTLRDQRATGADSATSAIRATSTDSGRTAALVSLAIFVCIANRVGFPAQSEAWGELAGLQGLAAQSVRFGYLQPSEFGCLSLLGVALLQRGHANAAGAALGVSTLFNASLALPCGVFLAAAWFGWRERGAASATRSLRSALLWFVLLGAPAVLRAIWLGFGPGSNEAIIILAERMAHHALPEVWWSASETARVVVMAAATTLVFVRTRGPLRFAMIAGLTLTLAGSALVGLTGSERIGLLFPWRSSTILYPISLAALLAGASNLTFGRLVSGRADHAVLGVLALALLLGTLVAGEARLSGRPAGFTGFTGFTGSAGSTGSLGGASSAQEGFAKAVRDRSDPDETVLLPPSWEWQEFRLAAARAVFVDVKNHPYGAADVIEWNRRVESARRFQGSGPEERQRMCLELGVDSYVIAARRRRAPEEPTVVAHGYALVRCPR